MGKVLATSIVAVVFIIITAILIIARRKKWLGDDWSETLVSVSAIVSGIAAVVAVIVAILSMPDSPPQPAPVVALPTPASTATSAPPTLTPIVTTVPPTPTPNIAPAPFFDDFETETIDPSMWDMGEVQYVSVKEGHLYFDVPLNDSGDWVDHLLVKAQPRDSSISRIMFTFKLDMPAGHDAGWLFLATNCNPAREAMWVHAGGQEGEVYVKYGMKDGDEKGTKIYFKPVAYNQPHTIDLRWIEDHVQIRIDEQPQDKDIPCKGPARYVHFGAVLSPTLALAGYLDDVSIWP